MGRWAPIKKTEGRYSISDEGDIRFESTKRIRTLTVNQTGYFLTVVKHNGKLVYLSPHKEVMYAFVGERPEKMEINHKDGNKLNNKLENLEYVTSSQNASAAYTLRLRSMRGEKNPQAKLTKEDVIKILKLESKIGFNPIKIAETLKLPRRAVEHILNGDNWKHLPEVQDYIVLRLEKREKYKGYGKTTKITEMDVRNVIALAKTHKSMIKIATELNLPRYAVEALLVGKTWKHMPEVQEWNRMRGH